MNQITNDKTASRKSPFNNSQFHVAAVVSVLILVILAAISGFAVSQSDLFLDQVKLDGLAMPSNRLTL